MDDSSPPNTRPILTEAMDIFSLGLVYRLLCSGKLKFNLAMFSLRDFVGGEAKYISVKFVFATET